ncbi:hypothetical protein C8R45DRAFT_936670 [Mycena sanguinolenta]|nr:hypothetical protein C8R45DRAFT_936670 [Mycena sanguinolenta]
MSSRERRTGSGARPGDIINNTKQKRRTTEEVQREKAAKLQAKEEKERARKEKKNAGVRRIADLEAQMRQQDQRARATAARPDLRTAEMKRAAIAQAEDAPATPSFDTTVAATPSVDVDMGDTLQSDVDATAEPEMEDAPDPDQCYSPSHDLTSFDDGNNSDDDPSYEPEPEEEPQDAQGSDDDDSDLEAQIAAFAQGNQEERPTSNKRKPTEDVTPADKKPKAAAGGLRPNWQKDLGLAKPPKKSSTSWHRSVSIASSTSATSGLSGPSAFSEPEEPAGEFDEDEDESSMREARAAKSGRAIAIAPIETAKMGITLTKKESTVDASYSDKPEASCPPSPWSSDRCGHLRTNSRALPAPLRLFPRP